MNLLVLPPPPAGVCTVIVPAFRRGSRSRELDTLTKLTRLVNGEGGMLTWADISWRSHVLPFPEAEARWFRAPPFHTIPCTFLPCACWQDSPSEDSPISSRIVFLAGTQTPLLSLHVSDTAGNDPLVQGVFSHCGSGRPVPLSLTFDLLLAASSLSVKLEVVGISQLKPVVPSV